MQRSVPTPSWASFISFLMDINNFTEHEHQKGHWMFKMDQDKNCVISLTKIRQIRTLSNSQTDPPFPSCLHMWVLLSLLLRSWCLYLLCLPSGREAWKPFSTDSLLLKISNLGQSFASPSLPGLSSHNWIGAPIPEWKYPYNRPQGELDGGTYHLPWRFIYLMDTPIDA